MAWDDDDKKNPWQKQGDKGPADLDQIVRDFQKKLSGLLGSGGKGRGGDGAGGGRPGVGGGVVGSLGALALIIWGLTGIYTVDEAERAIVLRFGEHVSTQLPGLRWRIPWPIESVIFVNSNRTETHEYDGRMLTRDENIVHADLTVQYRRTDPELYLFNIEDPEGILRDVTASAIREIVGANDLDFILSGEGRTTIAAETQALLQDTLDSYGAGITIFEVNLEDANFPSEVESAVQDAVVAREDRDRAILEAESYRNDILPRARGQAARQLEEAEAYRSRIVANAEGEADRFVRLLNEYQLAPEVTRDRLWLETLEQILGNSTKVIVDTEGGNNLLYLPLDQLTQQRRSATTGSGTTSQPSPLPSAGASGSPQAGSTNRSTR